MRLRRTSPLARSFQLHSEKLNAMPQTNSSFQRLRPSQNLANAVVDQIRARILQGEFAPGDRLPTEQEMVGLFGVSRTVVREAIAALRAEGLVATRQGMGAFVVSNVAHAALSIHPQTVRSVSEILDVMELRTVLETEVAALAAERRSKQDLKAISGALRAVDKAIRTGSAALGQDFEFHLAIASATNNPNFAKLLEFLGRLVIPPRILDINKNDERALRTYLEQIQSEHRDIESAIREGDVSGAREAMRHHLMNGRERYRKLVE